VTLKRPTGGGLHIHLRGQKTYSRRSLMGNDSRGQMPNRVSIHLCPLVIEERSRLGDIEVDRTNGRHH
jgi:IS30 family transposase